jgi:hypothetical protein
MVAPKVSTPNSTHCCKIFLVDPRIRTEFLLCLNSRSPVAVVRNDVHGHRPNKRNGTTLVVVPWTLTTKCGVHASPNSFSAWAKLHRSIKSPPGSEMLEAEIREEQSWDGRERKGKVNDWGWWVDTRRRKTSSWLRHAPLHACMATNPLPARENGARYAIQSVRC